MITVGNIIICNDGKRFLVEGAPNGELVLLDIDTFEVRYVDDVIVSYINAYHYGIAKISNCKIISA